MEQRFSINHIGIIMDGNRRWAKAQGLNTMEGHREGAKTLKKILDSCQKIGVKAVSVYALSAENIKKRPAEELAVHFGLHKDYIKKEILDSDRFLRDGIRFNVFGRIEMLPKDEQEMLKAAMEKTKNCSKLFFNACLAYDGQDEIVDAVNSIIAKGIKKVDRDVIKQHLYTRDVPAPELIIRTGMSPEQRLSGFLLWDSSYSEFFFTKTLWPAFSEKELIGILEEFSKRDRRMGK